ncbi:MAG: CTP synthase [Candidatus Pacebacteria bacterium]|nr:CTP synthase [Candidatus Paceibacterota bacterium]
MKNHKYIFVVGGVMSGIGKGITASSIGKILQARGLKVTALKIDPYVNVDAGTMNPTEHGEVAVLDDGFETDQDMLNYERFLNITLPNINYMTTGRVYLSVIEKERNLEYKGKCVQVVPHVPLEIIERIEKAAKMADADVSIIEIGGTVGEYENVLFLEAARMLKNKYPEDVMYVMLSYLPIPSKIGEMKTKPTQHAVRNLNATGIQPDILVARSDVVLDKKRKEKIALFCNIDAKNVVSAPDVESIYDVPLNFEKDKISDLIVKQLKLEKRAKKSNLNTWRKFVKKVHNGGKKLDIAIVGKYFDSGDFVLADSYISVIEAIKFSAYKIDCKPKIHWLNSKDFESGKLKLSSLKKYDGIIVPGGFGSTGIEGKIQTIEFARKNKIPFLGLCYGMQLAVIEYARNVLKMDGANTVEIDSKTKYPVIDLMPEQKELMKKNDYGGTMRLGACSAILKKGTIARKAYAKDEISERHRHRFEVNPDFIEKLTSEDLVFSGTSPNGKLMEILELKGHPFFVATQFHPEYKARPLDPHPLFTEFLKACKK